MKQIKRNNHIRESFGDRVVGAVTTVLLALVLLIVGYPILYVISSSFSSSKALSAGKVLLLPKEFTLSAYHFVLNYKSVWIGYRNSILYTVLGVGITMFLTIACAYPLSRPNFRGNRFYTIYFMLTMLFGAGMIPNYLLRINLGMYNSIWAVVLAGSLSFTNVAILRTAFKAVPIELYDAAKIDGANELQILFKLAIPLAKASISVIVLYSLVGCWNEYFNAMLYLQDVNKFPLQLVLRTILTGTQQSLDMTTVDSSMQMEAAQGLEAIKYALIVVATVPVIAAYGVVQKFFEKGVMIGSVKG